MSQRCWDLQRNMLVHALTKAAEILHSLDLTSEGDAQHQPPSLHKKISISIVRALQQVQEAVLVTSSSPPFRRTLVQDPLASLPKTRCPQQMKNWTQHAERENTTPQGGTESTTSVSLASPSVSKVFVCVNNCKSATPLTLSLCPVN